MNQAIFTGTLLTALEKDHSVINDVFYRADLLVNRRPARAGEESAPHDILPLMVSSYALIPFRGKMPAAGDTVQAIGELRLAVYLTDDGTTRRQELYLLITELHPMPADSPHQNQITVSGELIRAARYRSGYTEDGRVRESSSLSIAVPFGNGSQTAYITILSNGRPARASQFFVLKDVIEVSGRIHLEDREITSADGTSRTLRVGYIVAQGILPISYAPDADDEAEAAGDATPSDTPDDDTSTSAPEPDPVDIRQDIGADDPGTTFADASVLEEGVAVPSPED